MGPLTKGNRLQMSPLQAADLHAYEVYRYFSDQMRNGRSDIRGSFRELLKIPHGGGYLLAGDKLSIMIREVVRQRFRGVTELIDIPVDRLDREQGIRLRRVSPAREAKD